MREILITTLNGEKVRVRHHVSAERCWEMLVPGGDAWERATGQALFRDDDAVEVLANGEMLIYSRSLARLMELVAEFIGATEA